MIWYSVSIDTTIRDPGGEVVEDLLEALVADPAAAGPVAHTGLAGVGATVSVKARGPVEALTLATQILRNAAAASGLTASKRSGLPVARAEVMTEDYQDRWLAQPPDTYVGLAEVADVLGVSKTRVLQLRGREDFPEPVAELASGPVWSRMSLNHFMAGWDRRPGRRPTVVRASDHAATPDEVHAMRGLANKAGG